MHMYHLRARAIGHSRPAGLIVGPSPVGLWRCYCVITVDPVQRRGHTKKARLDGIQELGVAFESNMSQQDESLNGCVVGADARLIDVLPSLSFP
ncbi:hypothetical protein EVAR_16985_1 [Eumeta japonica]|uniref:Uncharacterized protein n=1 Tax=Eumeta variegata TaxID=151549 RepID=A0A4C1TVK1_EUMVA|nr:hypothetical protein EVAR_16985_1 [Eumeta japonica]